MPPKRRMIRRAMHEIRRPTRSFGKTLVRGSKWGTVLAAALWIALGAPAAADLGTGRAAYRQGDYARAITELLPLAEQGDREAQYYVGAMYEAGLGMAQTYGEATKWYRKAAELGSATAQYHLGVLYEIGEGVGRDHARAAEWYRLAAERGYAPAQSNLGSLYLRGWSNIEANPVEAHLWFSLAEEQDFPGAKKNRMNAARFLSRDGLDQAERLAREWRPATR